MKTLGKYSKQLIGRVGERLAREELENQGYELQSFDRCKSNLCIVCGFPIHPYSKDFRSGDVLNDYPNSCSRGKRWLELLRYRDKLRSNHNVHAERGLNLDFYATKNDDEYVIEVKTNRAKLTKAQKKLMEYAQQLNFHPLYVRVRVSVSGEVTEVRKF